MKKRQAKDHDVGIVPSEKIILHKWKNPRTSLWGVSRLSNRVLLRVEVTTASSCIFSFLPLHLSILPDSIYPGHHTGAFWIA